MFNRIILAGISVIFMVVGNSAAQISPFAVKGFSFKQELVLPVSPDTLFDVMTGDILPWWDHHFSEQPRALYIEPRAGGGFYEVFDDAGNGCRHAEVIFAQRGKTLRFEGPLGLSGTAFSMVVTWDYAAAEGGTRLALTVNMLGQLNDGFEEVVASVWNHFLVEQLKPYVESGNFREKFNR